MACLLRRKEICSFKSNCPPFMKLLFPGNENTPYILNEIPPNHASQASFLTLRHVPSSSKLPLLPQRPCYVLCHSETKLLTKTNHILFSFKTTCLLQEIPKWEHRPTVKTPSQGVFFPSYSRMLYFSVCLHA